MKFELDGQILELQDPSQYPSSKKIELIQVKERSATGTVHVETYEVQTALNTYKFNNMSSQDYENLLNWFTSVVEGMKHSFLLTDDLDNTTEVMFISPILDFELTDFELWSGSFTVEAV